MELIWARAAGLIRRGWRATMRARAPRRADRRRGDGDGRRRPPHRHRLRPLLRLRRRPRAPPQLLPAGAASRDRRGVLRARASPTTPSTSATASPTLPEVEAAVAGLVPWPDDRARRPIPTTRGWRARWRCSTRTASRAAWPATTSIVEGRAADAARRGGRSTRSSPSAAGSRVGDRVVLTFWATDELGHLRTRTAPELHGPPSRWRSSASAAGSPTWRRSQDGFAQGEASLAATSARRWPRRPADAGELRRRARRGGRRRRRRPRPPPSRRRSPDRPFNVGAGLGRRRDRPHPRGHPVRGPGRDRCSACHGARGRPPSSARRWSGRADASGATVRSCGPSGSPAGQAVAAAAPAQAQPSACPPPSSPSSPPSSLSPLGPVGVGRRRRGRPRGRGRRHGAGSSARSAVIAVVTARGVRSRSLRRRALLRIGRPGAARHADARRSPALPPVATAGIQLARAGARVAGRGRHRARQRRRRGRGRRRGRVAWRRASTTCAETPARFGAPWDVSVRGALRGRGRRRGAARGPGAAADGLDQAASSGVRTCEIGGRDRRGSTPSSRSRAIADEVPSSTCRSTRAGRRPPPGRSPSARSRCDDLDLAIGDRRDARATSPPTGRGYEMDDRRHDDRQRHLRSEPGSRGRRSRPSSSRRSPLRSPR